MARRSEGRARATTTRGQACELVLLRVNCRKPVGPSALGARPTQWVRLILASWISRSSLPKSVLEPRSWSGSIRAIKSRVQIPGVAQPMPMAP